LENFILSEKFCFSQVTVSNSSILLSCYKLQKVSETNFKKIQKKPDFNICVRITFVVLVMNIRKKITPFIELEYEF